MKFLHSQSPPNFYALIQQMFIEHLPGTKETVRFWGIQKNKTSSLYTYGVLVAENLKKRKKT